MYSSNCVPTIYDVFDTKDSQKVFVGVVSDTQWKEFCEAFNLKDLWQNDELKKNNGRVDARNWLKPKIENVFLNYNKKELMDKLEKHGIPFAPIAKPHELFDDIHLNQSDGLSEVTLTDGTGSGKKIKLPNIPISFNQERLGVNRDLPRQGEHTYEILSEIGISPDQIDNLLKTEIVSDK